MQIREVERRHEAVRCVKSRVRGQMQQQADASFNRIYIVTIEVCTYEKLRIKSRTKQKMGRDSVPRMQYREIVLL